ncbi:MAG: hypothetical protein U0Q11_04585 [Vicinamibacterales bacterium]
MKKRFSKEQIRFTWVDGDLPAKDGHGFLEASHLLRRSKFGGMSVPKRSGKELEIKRTAGEEVASRSPSWNTVCPLKCSKTVWSRPPDLK